MKWGLRELSVWVSLPSFSDILLTKGVSWLVTFVLLLNCVPTSHSYIEVPISSISECDCYLKIRPLKGDKLNDVIRGGPYPI